MNNGSNSILVTQSDYMRLVKSDMLITELQSRIEELEEQNSSVRSELGALGEELHQREDMLGVWLNRNKALSKALRGLLTTHRGEGLEREYFEAVQTARKALAEND